MNELAMEWALITRKEQAREAKREKRTGEGLDLEEQRLAEELERERPKTRGDCKDGARPCPYLSCRFHLLLDVTPSGSIALPLVDLDDVADTCALDVADRGGMTLEAVGSLLGVTRERVRQIEVKVLAEIGIKLEEHDA